MGEKVHRSDGRKKGKVPVAGRKRAKKEEERRYYVFAGRKKKEGRRRTAQFPSLSIEDKEKRTLPQQEKKKTRTRAAKIFQQTKKGNAQVGTTMLSLSLLL